MDMARAVAVYEVKAGTRRGDDEDTLYAIEAARRYEAAWTFADFVHKNGICIIQGAYP